MAKSGDLQALENWLLANIDKKDTIHKGGVTKSGYAPARLANAEALSGAYFTLLPSRREELR